MSIDRRRFLVIINERTSFEKGFLCLTVSQPTFPLAIFKSQLTRERKKKCENNSLQRIYEAASKIQGRDLVDLNLILRSAA